MGEVCLSLPRLLSFTSASAQAAFTSRGYAPLRTGERIAAEENDLLKQKESTRAFPLAFPKHSARQRASKELGSVSSQARLRLVSATLCIIRDVLETHGSRNLISVLKSGYE